jgi:hypothetical protein
MSPWMLVATMLGAGILLVPVLFQAWFERAREERRRRTEALVTRAARDAKAEPPLP